MPAANSPANSRNGHLGDISRQFTRLAERNTSVTSTYNRNVARLSDWLDLGKSTVTSISTSDMTNLYMLEWPETRNNLIGEHRAAIAQEPRRLHRWVRTVGAVFFGLAKRLAPHRRILFALSFVAFFLCLAALVRAMETPPFWVLVEITATFLVMTLLLAMELIDKLKYRDELQLARDLQA